MLMRRELLDTPPCNSSSKQATQPPLPIKMSDASACMTVFPYLNHESKTLTTPEMHTQDQQWFLANFTKKEFVEIVSIKAHKTAKQMYQRVMRLFSKRPPAFTSQWALTDEVLWMPIYCSSSTTTQDLLTKKFIFHNFVDVYGTGAITKTQTRTRSHTFNMYDTVMDKVRSVASGRVW